MNNDERNVINSFFERVGGKGTASQGLTTTAGKELPPLDPEANQLIVDNFRQYPEAGYRITQMAVVQEAALVEAQNRIRQLEWQMQQMQQEIQRLKAQQAQQTPSRAGGGFLGGLFGGRNQAQPQPQPQRNMPAGWGGTPNYAQPPQGMNMPYGQPSPYNYPPGYQRGMFNQGGSGFLGSALSTAAGVAGGMMAYNALSNLFSGHHESGMAAGNGAFDPSVNSAPITGAADPFAGSNDPFMGGGTAVDPNFDAGNQDMHSGFDNGGFDSSGWGNAVGSDASDWNTGSGFDDAGSDWGGDDGGSWGDDF